MKNLRFHERTHPNLKYHPDFDIVERGEENLFIIGQGHRSGTILTDPEDYDHLTDAHLFIRVKDDTVRQNFFDIQEELHELSNQYSRVRHCALSEVVDAYTRRYGRPNSLEV